jgi:hypothetical protein
VVLREVPRPAGSKTDPTSLIFTPNTTKSCSTIGIAIIRGNSGVPAGIPLDQAGIGFVDLDETSEGCLFERFRSVTIEFQARKGKWTIIHAMYLKCSDNIFVSPRGVQS